jgi:hypothetical protein
MKNCFGNHSDQKASAIAGAFLMQVRFPGWLHAPFIANPGNGFILKK